MASLPPVAFTATGSFPITTLLDAPVSAAGGTLTYHKAGDPLDGLSLTIPAGSVSGIISVPILGDGAHEGDESFTLTLSGATGATITHSTGTGTVLDDD